MPDLFKIVDDNVKRMHFHPIDVKSAQADGWMTAEQMGAAVKAVQEEAPVETKPAPAAPAKPAGSKPAIAGAKTAG